MTLNNAAYAIDGARTPASAAREAVYTTGGGQSGVSQPADLRVLATAPNGPTLRIGSGSAAVLNGYQVNPDQAYTISNPSEHIIPEIDMPAATPALAYYLVCIVIGDPEFDQTGHPFMPSEFDPEVAETFEYVRPVVIPCSSDTTTFEQLDKTYPGIALARLAIPANTTTITPAMITDLRSLAQPRFKREIKLGAATFAELTSSLWDDWMGFTPTVRVPEWATKCIVICHISGILSVGTHTGGMGLSIGGELTPAIPHDIDTPGAGTVRVSTTLSGLVFVDHLQGQDIFLRVMGFREIFGGYYSVGPETSITFDVHFYEDVV